MARINELISIRQVQEVPVLSLYPNPVSNIAHLSYTAVKAGKISILVTDAMGRTVLLQQESSTEGINQFRLATGRLNKGSYYLQVIDGEKVSRLSFIKAE